MRVHLDKNLDIDVFDTIKTGLNYPTKSAFYKISNVNLCKLARITKN